MKENKTLKVKDLIATLSIFDPESEIKEISRIYRGDARLLGEVSLGQSYITRDGRKVKIISDEAEGKLYLIGLIENTYIARYQKDGEACSDRTEDIISDIDYQEIDIAGYKVRIMDAPEGLSDLTDGEAW